ncbi:hypothetical protein H4R20_002640 [Coemansia guatemalensis]|uniref:Uncharacterized protein n=1 Tax=Coemansia guatemalensis TaxID=2761395 RepID=A0A9W8HXG3_9FUNG|nr:hypothetical protein H4R20_002640 [Coemansia guatemalensis]
MFSEYLENSDVIHHRTSDHHPQSDLAEVSVKLFKSTLRHLQLDRPPDTDWVELVLHAIAALNNTVSETLELTPFERFYGVDEDELRAERNIPESEPVESAADWQLRAAEQAQSLQQWQRRRVRDYANCWRNTRWFQPGELVSVQRQGLPVPVALQPFHRLGPFSVVHRQGVVYYLADLSGQPLSRGIPGDILMPYRMASDRRTFEDAMESSSAGNDALASEQDSDDETASVHSNESEEDDRDNDHHRPMFGPTPSVGPISRGASAVPIATPASNMTENSASEHPEPQRESDDDSESVYVSSASDDDSDDDYVDSEGSETEDTDDTDSDDSESTMGDYVMDVELAGQQEEEAVHSAELWSDTEPTRLGTPVASPILGGGSNLLRPLTGPNMPTIPEEDVEMDEDEEMNIDVSSRHDEDMVCGEPAQDADNIISDALMTADATVQTDDETDNYASAVELANPLEPTLARPSHPEEGPEFHIAIPEEAMQGPLEIIEITEIFEEEEQEADESHQPQLEGPEHLLIEAPTETEPHQPQLEGPERMMIEAPDENELQITPCGLLEYSADSDAPVASSSEITTPTTTSPIVSTSSGSQPTSGSQPASDPELNTRKRKMTRRLKEHLEPVSRRVLTWLGENTLARRIRNRLENDNAAVQSSRRTRRRIDTDENGPDSSNE